jgi:hypothetical protein
VTCTRTVKSREDVRVGITDASLVLNWPVTNKSWALWKRNKHRRRVVGLLHHDHSNLNHRKSFFLIVGFVARAAKKSLRLISNESP